MQAAGIRLQVEMIDIQFAQTHQSFISDCVTYLQSVKRECSTSRDRAAISERNFRFRVQRPFFYLDMSPLPDVRLGWRQR